MMSVELKQIISSLKEAFNEPLNEGEERKIIFWTDIDKDFIDVYHQVEIDHVKVIHLHDRNQFYIKYLLEEEDSRSSYLIYTNLDIHSKDNWLYDTVLYSKTFYADVISLHMNELKIDQSLRNVVEKYAVFFDNKERVKKFKSFGIQSYTQEIIELAMMNAICKTNALSFESVLRTVLMTSLDDDNNRYLYDLDRFFDINTFWSYVEREYGYTREKKTLKTLFIHLTMTAFSQSVDEKYLENFAQFISENNKTNIYVFIDHWMNHKEDYKIFNAYVKDIESDIRLPETLNQMPIDAFQNASVFPYVDRAIIIYITNSLLENQEDYETYLELIQIRKTKHFYDQYKHIYDALYYVVKMSAFKKGFQYGIPEGQAIDLYDAYVEHYYLMDTYYRKFYMAYDAEGPNEILNKLKSVVEYMYTNWFNNELSVNWSQAVKNEMLNNWSLPGVTNQQNFYSTYVSQYIQKNERAFVIISDALRYEIAKELEERINIEIMGECELDTMLGVVPSVTKLGMAALLPHKQLELNEQGQVLVNGQHSAGIINRDQILKKHHDDSMAIHFEDVLNMNKSSRRETFKGKKLIYIYHDTVDAIGDNPATEANTFQAAEKAIEQLSMLVRMIRNDLSGTNIFITADHGFLFQKDDLEASDLLEKEQINVMDMKRRYMLSEEYKEVSGQLTIDTSQYIENEKPLYAYVPKATIRYRIQGAGAKFVHGGASLQEVVVPLLIIKNKRVGQLGAKSSQKVDIHLTSTTRRITNSIFTLDFFQSEKIEDKIIPRTIVVYMADDKGNILSNEKVIIGDLTNDDPKERVFNEQFVLKQQAYDRHQTYYLIMKDMETDIIVEKIPFTINLGIISDFNF